MTKNTMDQRQEWIGSRGKFLIERHIASAMAAAHWHDHVELNLLLEGQMTYLFNGRREQVEAGRLVLFWAAISHQTVAVTADAPLVCAYLPLVDFLALPIDADARRSIMQGRFLAENNPQAPDSILLPQWQEDWQSGSAARQQLVGEEIRLRMRRLILDNAEIGPASARAIPAPPAAQGVHYVELLTKLINSHYADPLTVPHLAHLAGIHASTANKAFRDILGISVNEYLTRFRMARAMERLTDTDASITQIGFDCGFGSSSHFYDIFKERTGTTPRVFRNSLKQG